ncbi:DUF6575 domain-containing protein [Paenibacillus urinalis]|uniref:DUF6575 domain-containing protein n=1 Tax=Paenibacillus urinalis TaxID=521520 RepID=A0AAX3N0F2_9BACL|nr:DUF6575 domain-containing protein [Paenibacillus urinalis]WDH82644.1 hypothetical protein PUW23_24915 [Paenibacillus urinalis]WDI00655.1 hypothetical protein PUW25_15335 [Paenibacillus urinalis]HDR8412839.1 hypothetical protein [Bacillus cereus]
MHGELYTPLGCLKILDVFFYYDGPRIFTCKNKSIEFLAFLVDELEESDHWLFIPVSKSRVQEIKSGRISIRDAITNAEDHLYEVHLPVTEEFKPIIQILSSDDIPDEYLPEEDSYAPLSTDTHYSELPPKPSPTLEEAFESRRDILDIAIEGGEEAYELGCQKLGDTLTSIQYTLYSLDPRWDANMRKPPLAVIEDNSANVTSLFESSFGIRIKSKKSANIFNVTPATEAMNQLSDLLIKSKNNETLKQSLRGINPRAVMWYQKFLNSVQSTSGSLKFEWASPNSENRSDSISKDQLDSAIKLINENSETYHQMTVKGKLIAINLKRNTFYIEGDDENDYSGNLSEQIKTIVQNGYTFEVPMEVNALIETKKVISTCTDKESVSYKLLEVHTKQS